MNATPTESDWKRFRDRTLYTGFCLILLCLPLRSQEVESVNPFMGIGTPRREVEAQYGKPIARQDLGFPGDTFTKYRIHRDDHWLGVQIGYWRERVANLTFHKVSVNGGKNLPFTEEELAQIRSATYAGEGWKRQDTSDKTHIGFGSIHIYSPQEVYSLASSSGESWIVFHHVPRADIVQIDFTDFQDYRNSMLAKHLEAREDTGSGNGRPVQE